MKLRSKKVCLSAARALASVFSAPRSVAGETSFFAIVACYFELASLRRFSDSLICLRKPGMSAM